jgi:hypothetical protein
MNDERLRQENRRAAISAMEGSMPRAALEGYGLACV